MAEKVSPIPRNLLGVEEGRVYVVPAGKRVLLRMCGSCLGGTPVNGVLTGDTTLQPLGYVASYFPLGEGEEVRIARRPSSCPKNCPGPCVQNGPFNTDAIYRLTQ